MLPIDLVMLLPLKAKMPLAPLVRIYLVVRNLPTLMKVLHMAVDGIPAVPIAELEREMVSYARTSLTREQLQLAYGALVAATKEMQR